MGGDLFDAPAGKSPCFLVTASKDPDEANLDRIQVIKGWVDAQGQRHEKIYDVALSDGREVDPATAAEDVMERLDALGVPRAAEGSKEER